MGGGGGVLAGLHIVLWPFPHSSVLIKRAKDRGMVSQALFRSSGSPQGQASRWHTCCIEHGFDPESAVLQLWLRSTAPWKLGACAWSSSQGFLTLTVLLYPDAAASCYCKPGQHVLMTAANIWKPHLFDDVC